MRATMMDVPLTLTPILDRAARLFGDIEIVSGRPDRSVHRATYADFVDRALRLANALLAAGLRPGDRVATLMWNHVEHLATYFGVPCAGGVLHTLNLRLHPDELAYIARHAGDRFLIVDDVLLPLAAKFRERAGFEKVIVVGDRAAAGADLAWDDFVGGAAPDRAALPVLDEQAPLGMCYTSGTTGQPKGVVYSHRSTVLHSLATLMADGLGITQRDTVLPVVPMFHANAWGIPFGAVTAGAKLVLPGPHLDAPSLLDLMERERVTLAAGVPTIWAMILDQLEHAPRTLQPGCRMVVGGSAAPEAMLRAFDRHGLTVLHAWGMTETSPIGSISYLRTTDLARDDDGRYAARARQGYPCAMVDVRTVGDAGPVPWDDRTQGELQVRGPWVAASYHEQPDAADRWTDDGWFRTGDVVCMSPEGSIRIVDRTKDLIKSGGEWISSIELENALVAHPAVREAVVVAVPHETWGERPLAVVVLRAGASATAEELRHALAAKFVKFWVPDAVVFVDAIPKTSTGKHLKSAVRDRFKDHAW
ncbi:MAG TPA: long-chain fatty acid--CoA ligase [Kofleriaceae bacterium]|nr:long-chain fatty acid--CoA ligase [Kofleriaceae bacterium]